MTDLEEPIETLAFFPADLTRRELLRAAAAAGMFGIVALAHGDPAVAGDVFVVKPYLQLGDASQLRKVEQMVVLWHSGDDDASWTVEFRDRDAKEWATTSGPDFSQDSCCGP